MGEFIAFSAVLTVLFLFHFLIKNLSFSTFHDDFHLLRFPEKVCYRCNTEYDLDTYSLLLEEDGLPHNFILCDTCIKLVPDSISYN